MRDDYNQDGDYRPLSHDQREHFVQILTEKLVRLQPDIYEALATPSCGVIDPHFKVRTEAAARLARILIRPAS